MVMSLCVKLYIFEIVNSSASEGLLTITVHKVMCLVGRKFIVLPIGPVSDIASVLQNV